MWVKVEENEKKKLRCGSLMARYMTIQKIFK